MKKKNKELKKIIFADLRKYNRKQDIRVMRMIILCVVIVSICFSILNRKTGGNIVVFPTFIMAFSMVICGIVSLNEQTRKMAGIISVLVIGVVYTNFTIQGYNEGFACLWTMVIPYATMVVLGLHYGLIISGYIMVMLCFVFWGPLQMLLQYDYPKSFRLRFPIIYMFCFAISFYTNFQLKRAQLREFDEKERLKEMVEKEHKKLAKMTMQTIISISNAVDAKDSYTKQHSERVANYAKIISQELGWEKDEQEDIYNMALLHDIGKIGVPDAILNKKGSLSEEEYPQIKKHPVVGGEILKDLTIINNVAKGAYYHHERYDGTGYPEGLKGEEIPIEARVIGIADAIDAMNSDRVYRLRREKDYILSQLEEGKGSQFDPEICEIVIRLIKSGKIRLEI